MTMRTKLGKLLSEEIERRLDIRVKADDFGTLPMIDAILDALYEPTESMLAGFGVHKGRMRLNWQAMLTAAKAER